MKPIAIICIILILASCAKEEPSVSYSGRWRGSWSFSVPGMFTDTIQALRKFRVEHDTLHMRVFDSPLCEAHVTGYTNDGYKALCSLQDTAECGGVVQVVRITYDVTGVKQGASITETGTVRFDYRHYIGGRLVSRAEHEGECRWGGTKEDEWTGWR